MTQAAYRSHEVLGIRIDDIGGAALVQEMLAAMRSKRRLLVLSANAWLMTLARKAPWIRDMARDADIVYADSAGAVLAVAILTGSRIQRSTAPDWIGDVGRGMAAQGNAIFWLGGKESVVSTAARKHAEATGVRIAGWHDGFFDMSPGSAENRSVVDAINASGADFLILAMGMPRQELWIYQNWESLNVSVALTAGALVDRVAGFVHRPPQWMITFGLEWLDRLVTEPRRLWRRYLLGLPVFMAQILQELVRRRLGLQRPPETGSG